MLTRLSNILKYVGPTCVYLMIITVKVTQHADSSVFKITRISIRNKSAHFFVLFAW